MIVTINKPTVVKKDNIKFTHKEDETTIYHATHHYGKSLVSVSWLNNDNSIGTTLYTVEQAEENFSANIWRAFE